MQKTNQGREEINTYLENTKKGKNNWWRYALTILSVIVGFIVGNRILTFIKPTLKSIFPDGNLGKELGTFIIIGTIFGIALIAFIIAFKKFHQRPISSLIGIQKKFNFVLYIKGFVLWGILFFLVNLITDYSIFVNFIVNFNLNNFILLIIVGFVFIGIQSFFEELLIRGYIIQGFSLKIKSILILVISNGLIFSIMHFGYGLGSFLYSFIFGVFFAIIVLKQKQIEFVAGAHNANNLMLSLVFIDLGDAINKEFSWSVNWASLSLEILALIILTVIVYRFIK